jgi:zinc transport system permease protein
MKIVGVLLVIAFLIVPAVAARPFAATPERMALIAGCVAVASVLIGLWISVNVDAPGGPSIVLAMASLAGLSLAYASVRRPG